jgi:hypothetical protein
MNRIEVAITIMSLRLQALPPSAVATANVAASLTHDEYMAFQDLKSLATSSNWLTLEEGMTIFGYMGHTVEHFNKQRPEVKIILNLTFLELHNREVAEEEAAKARLN